jgi:hypothetical protein
MGNSIQFGLQCCSLLTKRRNTKVLEFLVLFMPNECTIRPCKVASWSTSETPAWELTVHGMSNCSNFKSAREGAATYQAELEQSSRSLRLYIVICEGTITACPTLCRSSGNRITGRRQGEEQRIKLAINWTLVNIAQIFLIKFWSLYLFYQQMIGLAQCR